MDKVCVDKKNMPLFMFAPDVCGNYCQPSLHVRNVSAHFSMTGFVLTTPLLCVHVCVSKDINDKPTYSMRVITTINTNTGLS